MMTQSIMWPLYGSRASSHQSLPYILTSTWICHVLQWTIFLLHKCINESLIQTTKKNAEFNFHFKLFTTGFRPISQQTLPLDTRHHNTTSEKEYFDRKKYMFFQNVVQKS